MKVLLTGAFGNIGQNALAELVQRGHTVRCFDVPTQANKRAARRLARQRQVEVLWGDLRRLEDVAAAVQGQEAVVHLAFVVPKLSATGVGCEERPDWARSINVGGTMNLLMVMRAQQPAPKLLFASSLHVYGRTQHQAPPRTVTDPVQPVEHYALHKVACEEMVKASGLSWAILRLGAAMPVRLILDPGMFDVPLDNRIEYVHTKDVAVAIANALTSDAVWGRTWLVGGGPRCQYYYREIVQQVLAATGVGMLPAAAFATTAFATDWLDTAESQQVLTFQQRTLANYCADLQRALGLRRLAVTLLRPVIRRRLLRLSPYYQQPALGRRRRPVGAGAEV